MPCSLDAADAMVGAVGLGKKASTDTAENEAVYDNWASTYSSCIRAWGYDAPAKATAMMLAALSSASSSKEPTRGAAKRRDGLRIIDVGGDMTPVVRTPNQDFHPLPRFVLFFIFIG